MLFSVTIVGLLAGFAIANPEPQLPEQTTEAVLQYQSYVSVLQTEAAIQSLSSVYRTDDAGRSSFASAQLSIFSEAANGVAVSTTVFEAFPTNVRGVLESVYSRINAIGTANGFSEGASIPTRTILTSTPTPTGQTPTNSANAAPMGMAVGLGAAMMGGFAAVVGVL